MTEQPHEVPALDGIDGDEADQMVGEKVEPDHDLDERALAGEKVTDGE